MKCYFCGANNPENMMFCRQCGAVLSESQDETQEEIIEEASEGQPEGEDPVLEYYRERPEKKMEYEKVNESFYELKMTRKEFQDRYIRQIENIIILIFIIYFMASSFVTSITYAVALKEGINDLIFLTIILVAAVYFGILGYRKYGGMWTYGEYLRKNPFKLFSARTWKTEFFYLRSPNWTLGLLVVCILSIVFITARNMLFDYILIFAFIVAEHTLMYIWLGSVYDRYKENGYLPKWLEFIQRF